MGQNLVESQFNTGATILNVCQGPPNGPPFLFLPGFSNRWQHFLPILPIFIQEYQVFSLDYRGHGASSRTPGAYNAALIFSDVDTFFQRFIQSPTLIFGHSMGGSLALYLAVKYPQYVSALILGDASLDVEEHQQLMASPPWRKFWRHWRNLAGHSTERLVRLGIPKEDAAALSKVDPAVLDCHAAGRLQEFFAGAPNPDLSDIQCPILFLQGNPQLGGMMSDGEVRRALAIQPNASFQRIENAGHDLGFSDENLTPLMTALTSFLEKVNSGR
jgi:pimeloyl-ACP methyl ester carboxylesterase